MNDNHETETTVELTEALDVDSRETALHSATDSVPQSEQPNSADQLFDSLGISVNSVKEFLNNRDKFDSSKQVCICGHAINKHSGFEEGYPQCLTGRHYCPCLKKRPVLYTHDTRFFMRKTYGPGSKHALAAGLLRLREEKINSYWLEEPQCWHPDCSKRNKLIFPVALNKSNQIVDEEGPINIFLCETCILNMKGVPGNEGKGWIW